MDFWDSYLQTKAQEKATYIWKETMGHVEVDLVLETVMEVGVAF